MEWYYWVIAILAFLYYLGKNEKSKNASTQKKDSSSSNFVEKKEKIINKKTILRISDEISEIKKLYVGYFDNWDSFDFTNMEKIETNFSQFTTHFKLYNTYKKTETEIRFFGGKQVISRFELKDFPEINESDINKLKNLKTTVYSSEDLELHVRRCVNHELYSTTIYDEINNLDSKLSLRKYFYAIELAYTNFVRSNCYIHQQIIAEFSTLLNQLKLEFSELIIDEKLIRNDLYNILLNISKLIDEAISLIKSMEYYLDPIRNDIQYKSFEGFNLFTDVYGGEYVDGVWYEKRSRKYYYNVYCFIYMAEEKVELYVKDENNLLKIEELIFSYISIFMIIMKDFISSSKTNKYLVFRLDIEKKGVLLNHFETTLLSKIDEINLNLIDLNTILKKNHIEIMQSLDEINQNISNMNSGLSMISTKLNEINSTTNQLTTLQKWNNLFTVANLHYTIKTSNYLKNK